MKRMDFIDETGAYRNLWNPEHTGDWEKDFEKGKEYALQFMRCLKGRVVTPYFLIQIISAWPEPDNYTPVEHGFMSTVGWIMLS